MNRKGHVGMALLAFAPVAYVLIGDGKFAIALLGWLGIQAAERLPDQDFHLPFLTHRGVSHSLLAVLVVGVVLGTVGWLLGDRLFAWLYVIFSAGGDVWGWLLSRLPDLSADILTALVPNVPPGEIVATIQQQAGGSVNRWTFAVFGFFVGAFGILAHLLGDVITVRGIKPLLPFSERHVSLSPLRADNQIANSSLFFLGVLALVVVLVATSTGVGAAAAPVPADLSPVGVGAAQTQTQTDTPTTIQNQSQSQNQTQSRAAVVFDNQTSNGSAVTIERATLPEGGFVAIHTSGYVSGPAPADASVIAVSRYFEPGEYENVTIEVSNAPPGNYPGLNQSRLNESGTLAAVVYRDSNDNQQFDFVQSFGANDSAYTTDDQPVSDRAGISVPSAEDERRMASVAFADQSLRNNTLTVDRARLPNGGFLVVLDASYQQTGDPLASVIGRSQYLPPSAHTNVPIRLSSGALAETQRVTVIPAMDTNDNERYDYRRSDGFQDVAYVTASRSGIVSESARVRVPSGEATTQVPSANPTETPSTVSPTAEEHTTDLQNASGGSNESGGVLATLGIWGVAGILAVLAVTPYLIRKLRNV